MEEEDGGKTPRNETMSDSSSEQGSDTDMHLLESKLANKSVADQIEMKEIMSITSCGRVPSEALNTMLMTRNSCRNEARTLGRGRW